MPSPLRHPAARRRKDAPASSRYASARGQSLTEFALVLPLFLVLVMGVLDFGRMMAMHGAAVTASREGARYGAAHGESSVPQYLDCSGIREAVRGITASLITLSDDQITISYDDGLGNPRGEACPPHGLGPPGDADIQNLDRVIVSVTMPYEAITPIVNSIVGPLSVVAVDRRTIVKDNP